MKKTILSITICLLSFTLRVNGQQSPNPIVYRLSSAEITQCITPSAVAYNFIESILCRDYERMYLLCCERSSILYRELSCDDRNAANRRYLESGIVQGGGNVQGMY